MIPTTRLLILLAAPLALLATFPSSGLVPLLVAAWDLAVLGAMALSPLAAPPRSTLSARRRVAAVLAVGQPEAVTIELENRSARARELRVVDHPPPGCQGAWGPHPVRAGAMSAVELRYKLTPFLRGPADFGPLEVRELLPGGLAWRGYRFERAAQPVDVFPDFTARAHSEWLRSFGATAAPGPLLAKGSAEGMEFHRLRMYRPGDDPRKVDWKASARHRELVSREFGPERSQRVVIYVDTGRVMQGEIGELSAMDYVVNAAVALARLALSRGDLVGLLVAGAREPVHVPARRGLSHLKRIVTTLAPVRARETETPYRGDFARLRSFHPRRSMVVVFTRVLDSEASADLLAGLISLRPRHLPLCASLADQHVDRYLEVADRDEEDLARTVVAARVRAEQEAVLRKLQAAGCLAVHQAAESLGSAVIESYWDAKLRGKL